MGRILFLSAIALVAYRYISKSNQRHQSLPSGDKTDVEILPAAPATTPALRASASETDPAQQLIATSTSRAAESDPVR